MSRLDLASMAESCGACGEETLSKWYSRKVFVQTTSCQMFCSISPFVPTLILPDFGGSWVLDRFDQLL